MNLAIDLARLIRMFMLRSCQDQNGAKCELPNAYIATDDQKGCIWRALEAALGSCLGGKWRSKVSSVEEGGQRKGLMVTVWIS